MLLNLKAADVQLLLLKVLLKLVFLYADILVLLLKIHLIWVDLKYRLRA